MGQADSSETHARQQSASSDASKGTVPSLVQKKSSAGEGEGNTVRDLLKKSARVAKERVVPMASEYGAAFLEKTKEEAKKRGPVAEEYSRHAIKTLTKAYADIKAKHGDEINTKVKQVGKQASVHTTQAIQRGASSATSAINTGARTAGDVMSTAAKAAAQEAREAVPNALNMILRRVTILVFGSVFIYGLATSIPPAYVDYLDRRRKEEREALKEGPSNSDRARVSGTRTGDVNSGGPVLPTDSPLPRQSWAEWGRSWTDWVGITSRKKEQ